MNEEKTFAEEIEEMKQEQQTEEARRIAIEYIHDTRYREKLKKAFLKTKLNTVVFDENDWFSNMYMKTIRYMNQLREDGFAVSVDYDMFSRSCYVMLSIWNKQKNKE